MEVGFMKTRTFMLIIFLLLSVSIFAGEYTIGGGTSGTYQAPLNSYYDYSWSKSIYTKAEINSAGLNSAADILSFGYYVNSTPTNLVLLDQRVYMRHTAATVETAEYPSTTGFTLVFQGNVIITGFGWMMLDLNTPFAWNNTDNIEVLWENHDGSYTDSYPFFAYTTMIPEMCAATWEDETFPTGNGTLYTSRPNIRLNTGTTAVPNPVTLLDPPNGLTMTAADQSISWCNAGGNATGYRLYFGTTNPPPLIGDIALVTTWTSPTALALDTEHYWQVVPYNANGDAVNCPVWMFKTHSEWELQIGFGTTTWYLPLNHTANTSYSQTLYPASELPGTHHRIASISYNGLFSSELTHTRDVVIYMGNTDRSNFPSPEEYVPVDSLVQVFSGVVVIPPGEGWITINLDTPFTHQADRNLVIAFDENTPGADNVPVGFMGTQTSDIRSVAYSNVYTNADVSPSNPLASDWWNHVSYIPNTRIYFADDIAPTITHYPALNNPVPGIPNYINATIADDTTFNHPVTEAMFWYTFEGIIWESSPMQNTSGNDWSIGLLVGALGTTVQYYIVATDSFGNTATSPTYSFTVEDPTWLTYAPTTADYLCWPGYVWGPMNIYANPFWGTDNKLKVLSVLGRPRYTTTANMRIYKASSATPSWSTMTLIHSEAVTLPGTVNTTVDVSSYDLQIETPYFAVSFEDMPTGNYWARNSALLYNRSYMVRSGNIYNTGVYGSWRVNAYVTAGDPLSFSAPEVSISQIPTGWNLSWDPIPGAPYYYIWSSSDPYGIVPFDWNFEDYTTDTSFDVASTEARKFFRVTATTEFPSKGRPAGSPAMAAGSLLPLPDLPPEESF
jgi:hypothetical protein